MIALSLGIGVSQFRPPAVSPGGWLGPAYLNPAVHPLAVEGDTFEYENIAAAETAWAPRFPDYVFTDGCSIDHSVLYEGRPTCKITEGDQFTQRYLELSKYVAPAPSDDYWIRTVVRISPTMSANRQRFLFGAGGTSSWAGQYVVNGYNVNRELTNTESWMTNGQTGVLIGAQPLADLKALGFFAAVMHLTRVGGKPRRDIYVNDTHIGGYTDTNDVVSPAWGLIDMDIDCLLGNDGATPDPTNNYLHAAVFDYVNGDDDPDPWGLL
jgi:hypothetical protein